MLATPSFKKPKAFALAAAIVFFLVSASAFSQTKLMVKDKTTLAPLEGVSVSEGKKNLPYVKSPDRPGFALTVGTHRLLITYVGYQALDTVVVAGAGGQPIEILLEEEKKGLDEVVVVSSTRGEQRMENAPIKVEVLGSEEMQEENTIKPANIASILGDVSGVQIQQSSQVSGNANVRIQGLDGRYTQLVRDGMPLFDGFSGGFGVMQVPPLDLKQVELIKGSASTLYGGGAIGGLVNLISRKPTETPELSITLNQTSLKESNANIYVSKKNKRLGFNFFGGTTQQKAVDVNGDGFSDAPSINNFIAHPRVFIYPDQKTNIALGYTGTVETREGGDLQVLDGRTDADHRFFETNKTTRHTADIMAERKIKGGGRLDLKGSYSLFDRSVRTDQRYFRGEQSNYYGEASLFLPRGRFGWVGGINTVGNAFRRKPSDPIYLTDFSNNTVGAFAQLTVKLPEGTTLETGLRADHHDQQGDFLLPRISVFHRFNEHWGARGGIGLGYKTPNPLSVQNKDYDIATILPMPAGIRAERSTGYNAEANFKSRIGEGASVFINHAFFLTRLNDPVTTNELANGQVAFANAGKNITTKGTDTYVKLGLEPIDLYLGYTFTIAERNYLDSNKFVPLTPKNRFSFVAMYEIEGKWRVGLEGSYTGRQHRQEDYTETPGYFFGALLLERKFGKSTSLVMNCENLFDYRQSRVESLYSGSTAAPVFRSLWAPIDGRIVNLALRWKLVR